MSPLDIVNKARSKGLNAIAITDHNSALNCPALHEVCGRFDDIYCLYGMELTSMEEVHVLALFDDVRAVLDYNDYVYSMLADIPNNPDRFGDQVYVNGDNEIMGECDKYLNGALSLTMEELLLETHSRGGLFIPAHIDRPSYSVMSQLGFLPEADYDALEQHFSFIRDNKYDGLPVSVGGHTCTTASDAHYIDDIARAFIEFESEDLSISSLRNLLRANAVMCRLSV